METRQNITIKNKSDKALMPWVGVLVLSSQTLCRGRGIRGSRKGTFLAS